MKNPTLSVLVFLIIIIFNLQAHAQTKEFRLTVKQPPIEQCFSSGIDRFEMGDIKIFPNPGHEIINIEFTGNLTEGHLIMQIHALDGRLIYFINKQNKERTNPEKLDTSGLCKGIYLLKITDDCNSFINQIVIL